ncbi:bacteriocin class II family protein [Streptococcus equi]|uniref:bacteriocin class II family protein n=1 Tax=Streptococcus equi TaxID=1336 RepID=UPI0039C6B5A6
MNTETINQFDVMNIEALATVEGGYSGKDCLKDMGDICYQELEVGLCGEHQQEGLAHFQVHLLVHMLVQLQEVLHAWWNDR